MCLIVLAWRAHPDFPLVVAANRDEFHARPADPAAFWSDDPRILAGRDLEARGIYVRSTSWAGLAEEAAGAYKDIDEVIAATELAGISKPVARFTPIGNVKG